MKDTPILMSAPMVRASRRDVDPKTQTRRIIKPQPKFVQALTDGRFETSPDGGFDHGVEYIRCPYGQPGDRLWVKETFCTPYTIGKPVKGQQIRYRSTHEDDGMTYKWRPSIFMPRWASRLTLEVVSVRVERLQEISEGDAIEEGITWDQDHDYIGEYRKLWESINGPGSWDANPFVWVVEFKRI
jgi:hypothetical protein